MQTYIVTLLRRLLHGRQQVKRKQTHLNTSTGILGDEEVGSDVEVDLVEEEPAFLRGQTK